MYTLIKSITLRNILTQQLPALAISMVLAELFYKFHSFTLEMLAFLATWFAIDAGIALFTRAVKPLLWKENELAG